MPRTSPAIPEANASADDSRFPLVVAAASTAAALALFFSTTIDAIDEYHDLNRVLAERFASHQDLRASLDGEASQRISLEFDAQEITRELDRRGVFVGDVLPDVLPVFAGQESQAPPGDEDARQR